MLPYSGESQQERVTKHGVEHGPHPTLIGSGIGKRTRFQKKPP